MKMMNRRELLRNGIALGAAAGAGGLGIPSLAYANPTTDRYFVFCYFPGGWDTLVGLDPRDPEEFSEDRIPYTLIQPGYHLLPPGYRAPISTNVPEITLGPYIGEMARHADKMCIIRGMTTQTVGHSSGYRCFLTGKGTSGGSARGSSLATHMAALYGGEEPVPNLCMKIESYNDQHPPKFSGLQVPSITDLQVVLGRAPSRVPRGYLDRIDAFVQEHPDTQTSILLDRAVKSERAAQELTALQLNAEFDFFAQTAEMAGIRDTFQLSGTSMNSNMKAAIAAKAITGGLSRSVSFSACDNLDTHQDWPNRQGTPQKEGWDAVARLVDYLAAAPFGDGSSWLDHTTLLAFSEFMRTPVLNSNVGRDHHITNACMLLGAGIKRGVVLGASSDIGMGTLAVDLQSGALDPGGSVVFPSHIHRALLHDIGYTDDIYRFWVDPFRALLANG